MPRWSTALGATGSASAADERGVAISDPAAREIVYGMPYEEFKAKYQKEATPAQQAGFAASHQH